MSPTWPEHIVICYGPCAIHWFICVIHCFICVIHWFICVIHCFIVDDNAQMHEQSTFGRQDGKGQHDMELVQTGGNVNAVTSFGKQQEESHLNSPPQKVSMSVVAMQLADAGSDLEASSDDEEQTKASTPMLTEPVSEVNGAMMSRFWKFEVTARS